MLINEVSREYENISIGQDYITKQFVYRPSKVTYEKDGFFIDKLITYTIDRDWIHTYILTNFRQ